MLHKDTSEVVRKRAVTDDHGLVRAEEPPAGFAITIVWIPSSLHYWERIPRFVWGAFLVRVPPSLTPAVAATLSLWAAVNYADAANLLFDQQKQPFPPRRRLSTPPLRMIHHLSVHAPLRLRSPLRYCDRGTVGSENCVILNPQLDSVLCSCVRKRAKRKTSWEALYLSSPI